MLKLDIIGNIGKDATVTKLDSGTTAVSFSVAHSFKVKGENQSTWVRCTKWIQPGGEDKISQYIRKGEKIYVSGVPNCEVYEGKGSLTLNVERIELLGGRQEQQMAAAAVQSDPFAPQVSDPFGPASTAQVTTAETTGTILTNNLPF